MEKNLNQFRKEYRQYSLHDQQVSNDPFSQFSLWFQDAIDVSIPEPNAMILATASETGMPSARVVLLKGLEDDGFVFFTNYHSRKGQQISKNPQGALLFFWNLLERQIRIEGQIQKTSPEYSDAYFHSRPPKSRVAAIVSKQSTGISNREELEKQFEDLQKENPEKITRPENWGGYKLIPSMFEFWQGREHRLHDRIQYKKSENAWLIERLAP